jgi:hypothetical protein
MHGARHAVRLLEYDLVVVGNVRIEERLAANTKV